MYKVFFNDSELRICHPTEFRSKSIDAQLFEINKLDKVYDIVNHFLKSEVSNVVIIKKSPKKIWKEFKKNFKVIKAAGGVVVNNANYLFIFRRGKWDLPKGKIDKGESTKNAAIREVKEECGINNLRIIKKLPTTWHIYQSTFPESQGEWILKKTKWFEMENWGNEPLIPEIKEDITEARWICPEQFDQILSNTYPNLIPIVKLYC